MQQQQTGILTAMAHSEVGMVSLTHYVPVELGARNALLKIKSLLAQSHSQGLILSPRHLDPY